MKKKIKVLCISDYFLPGYLGGGPITTLANMRLELQDEVILAIFTRDRDLGSGTPYHGVKTDQWTETPLGPVFYASPKLFGHRGLQNALAERDFDAIYLNSFFSSRASIKPYIAARLRRYELPVLLAPRGEFSPGALAVKRTKKLAFVRLSRLIGLYRDVFWHASTEREALDILQQFPGAQDRVLIAPDPISSATPKTSSDAKKMKKGGEVRLAFISRISPMKNLDGLLNTLRDVPVTVMLDIFGPVEDAPYWRKCKEIISSLPANIQVKSCGPIAPNEVSPTFARYDLFAFPTHGENFGHVIFEALRAGTPVLISDQTPWQPDMTGAVTIVPLEDQTGWRDVIIRAAERGPEEQEAMRKASRAYAKTYSAKAGLREKNRKMFRTLLSLSRRERNKTS